MWPDPTETQRLLQDAARNTPGALNRLLASHREPLRQVIDRRLDRALGRRTDASDIVQSVLLEASRRLNDYLNAAPSQRIPFPLWLRRMARDHLIDTHRRHRLAGRRSLDREQPAAPDGPAASLPDPALTPAAQAIRKELEARFLSALRTLDADDREILTLRHLEQRSNSETARILGLTEPAAGMRHLRALRRLRVVLGEPASGAGP
jgi:RNA polymerase sigma-70 factor (ECF subfamily)